MIDLMLPLPAYHLSPARPLWLKFDGGLLSSDGGILVLREIEQRFASPIAWPPAFGPASPDQITHSLADIIGFRLLMIAAGYERRQTTRVPCEAIHVQDGAGFIAI